MVDQHLYLKWAGRVVKNQRPVVWAAVVVLVCQGWDAILLRCQRRSAMGIDHNHSDQIHIDVQILEF